MSEDQHVRVVCRIRPSDNDLHSEEKSTFKKYLKQQSKTTLVLNCGCDRRIFSFDYIANGNASQNEVFENVGKPYVQACLQGYNGTILCYGQTGSGKTFTVFGPVSGESNRIDNFYMQNSRGLVPRTVLIATISSAECNIGDTLSTLKFAQRAKFIRTAAVVNEETSGSVQALQREVNALRARLAAQSLSLSMAMSLSASTTATDARKSAAATATATCSSTSTSVCTPVSVPVLAVSVSDKDTSSTTSSTPSPSSSSSSSCSGCDSDVTDLMKVSSEYLRQHVDTSLDESICLLHEPSDNFPSSTSTSTPLISSVAVNSDVIHQQPVSVSLFNDLSHENITATTETETTHTSSASIDILEGLRSMLADKDVFIVELEEKISTMQCNYDLELQVEHSKYEELKSKYTSSLESIENISSTTSEQMILFHINEMKYNELNEKYTDSLHEIENMRFELSEKMIAYDAIIEDNQRLEELYNELQRQHTSESEIQQKCIYDLRSDVENANSHSEQLIQQIDILRGLCSSEVGGEGEVQRSGMQRQVEEITSTLVGLSMDRNAQMQSIQTLLSDVTTLKLNLDVSNARCKDLEYHISEIDFMRSNLVLEVEELNSHCKDLETKIVQVEVERDTVVKDFEMKIFEVEVERDNVVKDLEISLSKCTVLEKSMSEYDIGKDILMKDVDSSNVRCIELEAQMYEIQTARETLFAELVTLWHTNEELSERLQSLLIEKESQVLTSSDISNELGMSYEDRDMRYFLHYEIRLQLEDVINQYNDLLAQYNDLHGHYNELHTQFYKNEEEKVALKEYLDNLNTLFEQQQIYSNSICDDHLDNNSNSSGSNHNALSISTQKKNEKVVLNCSTSTSNALTSQLQLLLDEKDMLTTNVTKLENDLLFHSNHIWSLEENLVSVKLSLGLEIDQYKNDINDLNGNYQCEKAKKTFNEFTSSQGYEIQISNCFVDSCYIYDRPEIVERFITAEKKKTITITKKEKRSSLQSESQSESSLSPSPSLSLDVSPVFSTSQALVFESKSDLEQTHQHQHQQGLDMSHYKEEEEEDEEQREGEGVNLENVIFTTSDKHTHKDKENVTSIILPSLHGNNIYNDSIDNGNDGNGIVESIRILLMYQMMTSSTTTTTTTLSSEDICKKCLLVIGKLLSVCNSNNNNNSHNCDNEAPTSTSAQITSIEPTVAVAVTPAVTVITSSSNSEKYILDMKDLGIFEIIVTVCRHHMTCIDIIIPFCKIITRISENNPKHAKHLGELGVSNVLVSILGAYFNDISILEMTFDAIISISIDNDNINLLGISGICQAVVAILRIHSSCPKIVEQCLRTMRYIAINDSNNMKLTTAGAYEAIMDIVVVHMHICTIAEHFCRFVRNLAYDNDKCVQLGSVGACEVVVTALLTHVNENSVVEQGCCAIINLATNAVNNTKLGASGACGAVLAAMKQHMDTTHVVEQICCAIVNLLTNDNNCLKFCNAEAWIIILLAMKTHLNQPIIAEQSIRALRYLASSDMIYNKKIIKAGICRILVAVLHHHINVPNVIEQGCRAITCFSKDESNNLELGICGICDIITLILNTHIPLATITQQCILSIRSLSTNENNAILLGNSGVCEAIIAAMKFHSSTSVLAQEGCWTIYNLAAIDTNKVRFSSLNTSEVINAVLKASAAKQGYLGTGAQNAILNGQIGALQRMLALGWDPTAWKEEHDALQYTQFLTQVQTTLSTLKAIIPEEYQSETGVVTYLNITGPEAWNSSQGGWRHWITLWDKMTMTMTTTLKKDKDNGHNNNGNESYNSIYNRYGHGNGNGIGNIKNGVVPYNPSKGEIQKLEWLKTHVRQVQENATIQGQRQRERGGKDRDRDTDRGNGSSSSSHSNSSKVLLTSLPRTKHNTDKDANNETSTSTSTSTSSGRKQRGIFAKDKFAISKSIDDSISSSINRLDE
eukprot:gene3700-7360_t